MEEKKSLEKQTVKELREMALAMGGISGVSAMKKEELIRAIEEAKGVPLKAVREKPAESIMDLKKKLQELRVKKEELKDKGDRLHAMYLKKKISRLKKRTRRLARKVTPPGE